jgi:Polyketide cyclase / dehydrase and lipid transport
VIRTFCNGSKWIDWTIVTAFALVLAPAPAWSAPDVDDIAVVVRKDGPLVRVDVDCPVSAPLSIAWEVLTDYEHMAQFISNLESSAVQSRHDDTLRVHQRGKVRWGPLTFPFENVREIQVLPSHELHSRLISGSFKSSEFTTQLIEYGSVVHIVNHGRYMPDIWIPPGIGPALVEAEVRKQFGEIRDEILRRSARAGISP